VHTLPHTAQPPQDSLPDHRAANTASGSACRAQAVVRRGRARSEGAPPESWNLARPSALRASTSGCAGSRPSMPHRCLCAARGWSAAFIRTDAARSWQAGVWLHRRWQRQVLGLPRTLSYEAAAMVAQTLLRPGRLTGTPEAQAVVNEGAERDCARAALRCAGSAQSSGTGLCTRHARMRCKAMPTTAEHGGYKSASEPAAAGRPPAARRTAGVTQKSHRPRPALQPARQVRRLAAQPALAHAPPPRTRQRPPLRRRSRAGLRLAARPRRRRHTRRSAVRRRRP